MFNVAHIIETALLLLVAYLVGCIIGYGLRRLTLRRPSTSEGAVPAVAAVENPVVAPTPLSPEPAVPPPVPVAVEAAAPSPKIPSAAARLARTVAEEETLDTAPAAKPRKPQPQPPAAQAEQTAVPAPLPVEVASETAVSGPPPAKPKKPRAPKSPPADPKPKGLAAPRATGKDDLKAIKGIGPKIETALNDLGIFHFDQVAKLTRANAEWLDTQFGFKGRVARENWIEQAKALAAATKAKKT